MHPRNKLRLLAGLTIDPALERTDEARSVPMKRNELKKKTEQTVKAHVDGVTKAIAHLENAVKALERIPAHDFMGDVPHYINEIEEILSADGGEGGLKSLLGVYQDEYHRLKGGGEVRESLREAHVDADNDKMVKDKSGKKWKILSSGKGEGPNEVYHLECPKTGKKTTKKASELLDEGTWVRDEKGIAYENEEDQEKFHTADEFKKGEKVLYDNGIWIVHVTDAQADMVGVVPASMSRSSKEEKDRAMQQVKRDKIRKPSEEECEVMAGPDGILGTEDDVRMESMKTMMTNAMTPKERGQATGNIAKIAKNADEKRKKKVKESTLNYTPSNSLSYDDSKSEPTNVVGQDDSSWDQSLDPETVKDEYPSQLDQRGDQSMDDYANKVKVPSKVKNALKNAIAAFENDMKKLGDGHTASETRYFYEETAAAFQKILDYLNEGTIQSVKEAQVFASKLMGPMLHKIPDEVWDFIAHGGQKRSLKDYMSPVDKKYPITGPRNTE